MLPTFWLVAFLFVALDYFRVVETGSVPVSGTPTVPCAWAEKVRTTSARLVSGSQAESSSATM